MKKQSDKQSPSFSLAELAGKVKCPIEGDRSVRITGFAGLDHAKKGDITFVSEKKHLISLEKSGASAVILPEDLNFSGIPALKSSHPYRTFVEVVTLFHSPVLIPSGIHPAAIVSPTADLGKNAAVGALSWIGEHVVIGVNSIIFPLSAVYPGVRIGKNVVIHSHVTIREDVRIGDNVIIHSGAVIGADGFGYVQDKNGHHIKIPQTGTVIIEDDVEIGANSCIDRAALEATVIRQGTKIDDLVMVAHNCEVGEHSILAAQTGIAGSSRLGKKVITAGQVGIADHLTIGDGSILAAKTGLTGNLKEGSFVSGSPHLDIRTWRKVWASAPHLYDLIKEVRKLKKRVEELEKKEESQ
ncbi:MAG: UDP-3-O-(3-hydroxymyristoyl)glucosamine N-acyltransferase [Acidobacteria bacterium]|nr:UDP-3-O-(3-hydroxymyristoyl)glucosamine N-acyltransferase [Acidobacteriota bacterium]